MKIQTKEEFIYQIVKTGVISLKPKYIDQRTTPYFVNIRALYTYPALLKYAADNIGKYLKSKQFDFICGIETASLGLAGAIGYAYDYPGLYLRTKAKVTGQPFEFIEGHFEKGQSVYLIDDLTLEAQISMGFVESAKNAGLEIKGLAVVFEKMVPELGSNKFQEQGLDYFSIFTYEDLITVIKKYPELSPDPTLTDTIYKFARLEL